MELMQWLTATPVGKFVFTMLVSMLPVVELRGGLPFGKAALGLSYPTAFIASVLGNVIPAPFVIIYIRRVFKWLRRNLPWLNGAVDKLERKAHLKGRKVTKYEYLGLFLFVAIPLPGTGAWTGAMVAAFLDMPLRKALPSIILGVITAGIIMLCLTSVGINLFSSVLG